MAGSYRHLTTNGGRSMLEGEGDMHEALHELYWIARRLASDRKINNLLEKEYYPMRRGEIPFDTAMLEVKRAFGE